MSGRLDNKVAVVTGAARGIGATTLPARGGTGSGRVANAVGLGVGVAALSRRDDGSVPHAEGSRH